MDDVYRDDKTVTLNFYGESSPWHAVIVDQAEFLRGTIHTNGLLLMLYFLMLKNLKHSISRSIIVQSSSIQGFSCTFPMATYLACCFLLKFRLICDCIIRNNTYKSDKSLSLDSIAFQLFVKI
jgi:hypothetical protein